MADLVILNGRIITFDGPDAEALAIIGNQISAVGTNVEIRDLAARAHVLDAQGATVLPGFIDSHVHFFPGSVELDYLNLKGIFGLEQTAARARPYAAGRSDDQIVFACAIAYDAFGDETITRHHLDSVLPDRPFAAMAADHHTGWANTAALELAGLLHGAAVSSGSEVVLDDDGVATGELREAGAFGPVIALTASGGRDTSGFVTGANPVPPPTPAQRAANKRTLARGLAYCASQGITSLHNMDGNFYQLELLSELEAKGKLPCRIEVPMQLRHTDPIDRLQDAEEIRATYQGDMIWSSRIKMFMDGVVESDTAYRLDPYPGTDSYGAPLFSAAQFRDICIRADALGFQLSTHAIGDAAVRAVLDGYEAAQKANGRRDSRHRIEHIELLHPDDLPRFAELGVVASMQPLHAPNSKPVQPTPIDDLVYDHQLATAFAWRTIRNSGARLTFSTVYPVDVMSFLQAAVVPVKTPGKWPQQSLSLRDALAACTCENAWVEFSEDRKGRIRAGMLADVVVMDRDIERLAPGQLGTAKAAVTICDGRINYQAHRPIFHSYQIDPKKG